MPIDLDKLVAPRMHAPMPGQSIPGVWGNKYPVGDSPDLQRIVRLPRRLQEQDDTERAKALISLITERYGRRNTNCRCALIDPERHAAEGCLDTPRLIQAQALWEISIVGGLFGAIQVGQGKTFIDLLAALALAQFLGRQDILCVLCAPPSLVKQLVSDYDYIEQHWWLPSMIVQGKTTEHDRPRPGMPQLQVMPYSRIQRPESTSWLIQVKPTAMILDEAHKTSNTKTATGSRISSQFKRAPGTLCVAMTGSPSSSRIQDYTHIVNWCLKQNSPLPHDAAVLEDWSRTLNPSTDPAHPGALYAAYLKHGLLKEGEHVSAGYRRRLFESRGVVSAQNLAMDCELDINEKILNGKVPVDILRLIKQALDGTRFDGQPLLTEMEKAECAIQLACGVCYRWIYPKHKFPQDRQLIDDWFEARKAYFQEVRKKLKHPSEHLDSIHLLERAAARYHGYEPSKPSLPNWDSREYVRWRSIRNLVEHETEAVRLHPFLVNDVAEYAHKHKALIWYEHGAVGDWIAEVADIPMYGGGPAAREALIAEAGDHSVCASIKAHGTGTNRLQFKWSRNGIPNPAADIRKWEQLLGRTHRPGQPQPVVHADFWMHTAHMRKHVMKALRNAAYVEGTLAAPQKLRVGFKYDIEEYDDEE